MITNSPEWMVSTHEVQQLPSLPHAIMFQLLKTPLILQKVLEAHPHARIWFAQPPFLLKAYERGSISVLLPYLVKLQQEGAFDRRIVPVIKPVLELACLRSDQETIDMIRTSTLILPVSIWTVLGDNFCTAEVRAGLLVSHWV
jgi:hypothetical protein